MGTKAQYRKDKLRFFNKPMFTSVTALSTNVFMGGAGADIVTTEKVLLEAPIYAGTFSTENDMHFHAIVGGILSSSEGPILFHLNWGSSAPASGTRRIATLELSTSVTGPKEAYKPFLVEFDGRIVGLRTSSGQIAAVGRVSAGFSTTLYGFGGSVGSTGAAANNKMATSNLQLLANTTAGLNISCDFDSTATAGTSHQLHCTVGYIKYYS